MLEPGPLSAFTSAPFASRIFTVSRSPLPAAARSGVFPSPSAFPIGAPRSRAIRTWRGFMPSAAAVRNVSPLLAAVSGPAPFASRRSTVRSDPLCRAARRSGVRPLAEYINPYTLDLFGLGDGPHQRRGVERIFRVYVRAGRDQDLDGFGTAIRAGMEQRRCIAIAPEIDVHTLGEKRFQSGKIVIPDGGEDLFRSAGIRGKAGRTDQEREQGGSKSHR